MKNMILGLALAAVTFACASEPKAAVSDANTAPKAECTADCEKACCDAAKTECSEASKAECADKAKVCPVTGNKEIN
jgi:hypothetical protein